MTFRHWMASVLQRAAVHFDPNGTTLADVDHHDGLTTVTVLFENQKLRGTWQTPEEKDCS